MRRTYPSDYLLILASRAVYSLLWFCVAPVLPSIGKELAVPEAELGLLPAAFIVGAAAMQIPAGLLGARHGHERVAGLGLALLGLSSVAMSLARSWPELLAARALGGVGAGLFFSTAGAALVAMRPNAVGSALGWYNASFNIGAFFGYFWGYVASHLGWRASLALPGLAAAAMGALVARTARYRSPASFGREALALGLATFPFWGAVYAANSLTATWLSAARGVPPEAAGALSSASMLSGFLGGVGGRIFDRARRRALVPPLAAVAGASAFLAMPLAPVAALPVAIFLYGLSFSIYITAIYATGSRVSRNPAAGLAVINVTDMALGLHFSYLFTQLMARGQALPWLLLTALALASAAASYAAVRRFKLES